MKEEDIRPSDLIEEKDKLWQEDIEEMLLLKNQFKEVPCPACRSKNFNHQFDKNEFSFVKCQECMTLFINPRPSADMLKDFYQNSKCIKFWNDKIFPISDIKRRENIFKPRAERVIEICRQQKIPTNVLIDVGAGFGTFCEEVAKLKIFEKIIAIEPSTGLAESCRSKGIEVIEKSVEEAKIDEANVITNFELIEHLFDPRIFIEECYKKLSEGGLFILTTPNINGFDLVVLGKEADGIAGPNHINYFNPESLSILLKNAGFKILEIQTPGQLDANIVRNKILGKKVKVSRFLQQILIDNWETTGENFLKFLVENKLSSHMWIIAKK